MNSEFSRFFNQSDQVSFVYVLSQNKREFGDWGIEKLLKLCGIRSSEAFLTVLSRDVKVVSVHIKFGISD